MKKISIAVGLFVLSAVIPYTSYAAEPFYGRPPLHTFGAVSTTPKGLTPDQIKLAYNLPKTGGTGTIAVITAFSNPTIEKDLAEFTKEFKLAECSVKNKCLEIHSMSGQKTKNLDWSLETALDTEWAHAVAPTAKLLVVQSASDSLTDLMKAVDYVTKRKDVTAVSMSWGGPEFTTELKHDAHFAAASTTMTFFAASGDDGHGLSWPASSPYVVAVGGTSLHLSFGGKIDSETAWSGSGGGISKFETMPLFQKTYSIQKAAGKRALPDVAYNADPKTGYSVFHDGWHVVGGTSAGAPQWAAIKALGKSATLANLYKDKASTDHALYFRDIISGKNGDCTFYCTARARYDYVTGLGSPLTVNF